VVLPAPLEPLAEDWDRALVVVAHPDDMEYGGAAAVARWVGQGKHVAYCLVTSGEAGIDSLPPEEAGPLREEEQRVACAAVGVSDLVFLRFPDGMLEYGLALRRAIARQIRRHRPDVLVTGNFRETWDGQALNQADHIAVGRAVLDAARDAANRWVFRELLDEGWPPWDGVRQVWAAGSPGAVHGVDVTDTFHRGLKSLRAHEAYLAGLGPDAPDPAEFLESYARMFGTRLGCRFALAFEVFPLQAS
jgi:LmbE family N-acetylglucosaminyl deacetylase